MTTTTVGLPYLKEWRAAQAMSLGGLAARSRLPETRLSAIESGGEDFTGEDLRAIAGALGCAPACVLAGPPQHETADGAFENRLLAQMIRDICVEAVTTYDDMGRIDELRIAADADEFWLGVADLLNEAVRSISRTRAVGAFSALSGTTPPAS